MAKDFPEVIQVKVVELNGQHPTKPLSLQGVYREATGSLVGIADAESIFSDHLLRSVNTLARRHRHISIFQGGVALMNTRAHGWGRPPKASAGGAALDWINRGTSWWRAHNCLEYYFWFRSRLHLSARNEFIPLGGNTLFIRRDVLFELNGWKIPLPPRHRNPPHLTAGAVPVQFDLGCRPGGDMPADLNPR